jgi:hypothetical protein
MWQMWRLILADDTLKLSYQNSENPLDTCESKSHTAARIHLIYNLRLSATLHALNGREWCFHLT